MLCRSHKWYVSHDLKYAELLDNNIIFSNLKYNLNLYNVTV